MSLERDTERATSSDRCTTNHGNNNDNKDHQVATSTTPLQAPTVQRRTLLDLPTEVIIMCFQHLSQTADLARSRLVCKTLSRICDYVMWRHGELKVSMTTSSLERLKSISQKPEIARSIRGLVFDLSCYEANLAKDYRQYADCLQDRLRCHQSKDFPENARDLTQKERRAYDFINNGAAMKWRAFRDPRLDNLLGAYYFKFVQRYTDQQNAIQNVYTNTKKFARLLQRFTNVRLIKITDESTRARWHFREDHSVVSRIFGTFSRWCFRFNQERLEQDGSFYPDMSLWDFEKALPAVRTAMERDYTSICLRRSIWNSRSRECRGPGQMIHVLMGIFKALATSSCQPVGLSVSFSPHDSTERRRIAVEGLEAAKKVMQTVQTVDVSTTGHMGYISLFYPTTISDKSADNMTRLMRAVCGNHPKLEHLRVGRSQTAWLPNFIYEADLCGLFACKYTNLRSLEVYDISFSEERFAELVQSLPATLQKLHLTDIRLKSSNKPWQAARILLDELTNVQDLDCNWRCGCRYRGSNNHEQNSICLPTRVLGGLGDSRCPSGLWAAASEN